MGYLPEGRTCGARQAALSGDPAGPPAATHYPRPEASVARRQNFGFQKRQKEIEKQKNRDEKAEKKRARKEAAAETVSVVGGEEAEEESDPAETSGPTTRYG
jgi:hypothetical protein